MRKMREGKLKRLRHEWHGPLTAATIARAAGIGETKLREIWASAKADGLLPDGPRPRFAERSKSPIAEAVLAIDDVTGLDADASPIADPNRVCVHECGRLLAALHAHQPDHDHPDVHEAPDSWLRFDRKGMPTPTHGMLMAMCRASDAQGVAMRLIA